MACCCTLLAQAGRSAGLCLTGCRKEACHPGHQHQWVLTELVRSQSSNQSSNMDSISSAGGCLYLYSRYQHITFLLIRISSINMPLLFLATIILFFLPFQLYTLSILISLDPSLPQLFSISPQSFSHSPEPLPASTHLHII